MINVTKTYLPDKEKYQKYVDEIFANGWVTNSDPLAKKLERSLAEYLGVKNIVLVSNTNLLKHIHQLLKIDQCQMITSKELREYLY